MGTRLSRKGELKRTQIIEAAINRFATDGLFRVTLGAIAKDCGIKTSLLLYHFGGLDDLFFHSVMQVVQEGQALAQNYIAGAKEGPERLQAMVDAMFDWIAVNRKSQAIILQFYSQCVFEPRFKALNMQIMAGGKARIQRILDEGIALGVFPALESPTVAAAIQSLITGILIRIGISESENVSILRKATQESALKMAKGTVI